MHKEPHPSAGKTVMLKTGEKYRLEDWWDRFEMGSWMNTPNNPACAQYAYRATMHGIPFDEEVVYGKIGAFGHLMHESELDL